ncbi:MAG: replicative DNA helicase [Lachnospiraceae bacterium]|nr:replicative DNA helicase [Lachnospiraceae bacterium]
MEEEVIKRTMPHSIEAERSVIGSMMMNSEAVAAAHEILTEDDFYGRQYGLLFKAMVEMYTSGVAVDLMTLKDKLDHMDAMPELSDINFLKELLDSVPTSANAKYYAGIVREKSVLRQLIKTSEHIANTCYSGKEELDEILDETEKKVFSIVQNRGESEYVSIDKVVLNAMERIETVSKIRGTVTGLPSGYTDLDYKTSGFQKSDLVIIAARPAMGKTAFELNIAEYMAFRKNATVAIFSLEMSKEQLVNRLLALESSVDSQKIRTGDVDDGDWEKLIEGANTIAKSHMIIDDTASISISELKSKCRRYKREFDLGIVIIDYLQLMTTTGRSESRQQEISEISRSLKSLARELNVPIIALSQLGRAVESRPDKRPMLSDLRESGAIEQDADMVMFLYRDDYYNKESEKKGIAEVIIAKQRNGPIGTIELAWIPKYTKFANLERKKE